MNMKFSLGKMVKKSFTSHTSNNRYHHLRNWKRSSCCFLPLLLSTFSSSSYNVAHAFVPSSSSIIRSRSCTSSCHRHRHSSSSSSTASSTATIAAETRPSTHLKSSSQYESNYGIKFRKGDLIQVEVIRFGPLGASVEIIAHNSHQEEDLIPEDEEPLGYGLILQNEIAYFRAARKGVDVVKGEILPAYVDWERNDGKVDITLRKPGGKGKAEDLGQIILEKLQKSETNEIPIGDKSTPEDINQFLPGASKASFKRAVASLYKQKLVQPGKFTTKLM